MWSREPSTSRRVRSASGRAFVLLVALGLMAVLSVALLLQLSTTQQVELASIRVAEDGSARAVAEGCLAHATALACRHRSPTACCLPSPVTHHPHAQPPAGQTATRGAGRHRHREWRPSPAPRFRHGSSAVTDVGPPTGESTTNSPSTASRRSASPAMPEPP